VVANLEPRKIRGETSHGMLLAAQDANGLSIITLDREVEPGSKVS
jgi:methionyl-tRNA synthetase